MSNPITRYLAKRSAGGPWRLEGRAGDTIKQAVCVPVLAERDTLPATLDSLSRNPPEALAATLVVVIVNNTPLESNSADAVRENRETLTYLREELNAPERWPALRLGLIDASSEGRELPPKQGVGLARKIAMDAALTVLRDDPAKPGLIVSLDADTTVEPNYLPAIRDHFEGEADPWGAVIEYEHPVAGPPERQAAIVAYELFLRCHVLGLRYANSPYAHHTIGSAFACTARAYAAAGGMNRRTAGEDFYFIERLTKTGQVSHLTATTVYPSPRPSWRVPFGTGKRVEAYLAGQGSPHTAYALETYDILRGWLAAMNDSQDAAWPELRDRAHRIAPELAAFLEQDGFGKDWERLRETSKTEARFARALHERFGAFTTLKLIHHLRDNGHPDRDTAEVAAGLLERLGHDPPDAAHAARDDLDFQMGLLGLLRTASRKPHTQP